LLTFVDQTLFPTLAKIDISTGNKRAVLVREVFDDNHNYMKSGIHLRQVHHCLCQCLDALFCVLI
jgi:type I restriction enzyme M protein